MRLPLLLFCITFIFSSHHLRAAFEPSHCGVGYDNCSSLCYPHPLVGWIAENNAEMVNQIIARKAELLRAHFCFDTLELEKRRYLGSDL